jgi:hypothetical protein
MVECLAPHNSVRGSSIYYMKQLNYQHNEMTKIQEATETSLNIFNEIDSLRIPEESRVKIKALGQVLRSMKVILENERNKLDTQSAA